MKRGDTVKLTPDENRGNWFYKAITRVVGQVRGKRVPPGGPATLIFDAETLRTWSAREVRDVLTGRTTYTKKGG